MNPLRRTAASSLGALGGAMVVLGCGAPPAPPPKAAPPPSRDAAPVRPSAGHPLKARPGITARVWGPSEVPYQASAGGLGGVHATVRLANESDRPVDVGRGRVEFTATRSGVPFPCREHRGGQVRVREVAQLAPGEALELERDIDCGTTLLGRYQIVASVAFGDERPEYAGAFELTLVGGGPSVLRPYPGRPQLFVALVGEPLVRGATAAAWLDGAVAPAVVMTNGGASPILLGAVRVVLSLRNAAGAAVPCVGAGRPSTAVPGPTSYGLDVWKEAPFTLAPGASHAVSVPLRCGPTSDGDYRVDGFVVLGDGPIEEGAPVGPLRLKVTRDPALTAPSSP